MEPPAGRRPGVSPPARPQSGPDPPAAVGSSASAGDRGLGPLLEARPDLVRWLEVDGDNPDIDTPDDLAAAIEAAWAARVRATGSRSSGSARSPTDGLLRTGHSLFRDDPRRTGDAVLDVLLAHALRRHVARHRRRSGPICVPARRWRSAAVIALEPSPSMLESLGGPAETRDREPRIVEGRWPDAAATRFEAPTSRSSRMSAMTSSDRPVRRRAGGGGTRVCVAVMMERVPASAADPFWPPVHGESRVPLPALPDLLELLVRAVGTRGPADRAPGRFDRARRSTASSAASSGSTRRPEGGAVPGGARRADGGTRRLTIGGRAE